MSSHEWSISWLTVTEYLCHTWLMIYSVVVIKIRSFPHSWLITGFLTRVTRWVPHVKQELPTLPEHLSSPRFLVRFVLFDLLFYVWCFVDRCLSFCPFSFGHCVACHSSVSGCPPLGVFKLFLLYSLFSFPMAIRTFTSRPSQQFDLSELLLVNL